MTARPWPADLRFRQEERLLEIDFEDGSRFSLPYELLRVESPSAEVQGHGGDQKMIVPGKRNVNVTGVVPTGNYAVRIQFDDGHDTGIYSWDYLYDLGTRQDQVWQTYLQALDWKGLKRD
ncbi:DUF971 domain-containing protein [Iodidimonas sp. SYSU 1G8]|uniref:DUF971 domain-containing protein n=1 Tax=Iodidimonas sp. SYSU 1G8 TaxID=3133967 RepID=UPI0031FEE867